MHNVWLIARREYIERVRTRGFLITTVMIPLLMGGFIFGTIYFSAKTSPTTHIAVISSDTQLALDLQDELQQQKTRQPGSPAEARQPRYLVDAMDAGPETQSIVDQEIEAGELDGYLWIEPASTPGHRPTFTFTPRSGSGDAIRRTLAAALSTVLLREQLAHRGIVAADAETMLQPVQIAAAKMPRHQDREAAQVSVTALFFLMYMVIMLYGMNVARAIIEEKTSRIFEVLLATIRPEEMMAGKIIGVGSVGLTQVGIWLAAVVLITTSFGAGTGLGSSFQFALSGSQLIFFFVYFILGYVFYSSIAAAFGAMTNSEQELQQLNMFLVLPLAFCFIPLGTVLANPDKPISRILTQIPPFTPLLMYLRVSIGHPAPWEIALSIILMLASIYGVIWVTSRIYRIGVLMYGKRPNLPEILRWLKYS
jgi:ABC-2 type transport system permease protein